MLKNFTENEWNTVINDMPGGLCVFNLADNYPYINVTVWNRYLEEITGCSRDKINKSGLFNICSIKPERGSFVKAFAKANKKDTILKIKDKEGENRLIKLKLSRSSCVKNFQSYIALAEEVTDDLEKELFKVKESETVLRKVVNNTLDMVAIFSPDFRVKYISPSNESILGYPLEKIKDMTMDNLTFTEDKYVISKFSYELINSKEPVKCQFRAVCADGSLKYLETLGKTLYNKGILEGYILSSRDVSERVKTEEDLIKSKKRYRTLFNNVNDAIYLNKIEESGKITRFVEANDVACSRLGYTREKIKSMSVSDILPDFTEDRIMNTIKMVKTKGNVLYEAYTRLKSGINLPVEINSILLSLNNEKFIMSISRDITERKEKERVDEYERLRTEFFANISHELRTPVNVIFSALQLINSGINDTASNAALSKKYMPVMKQNCYRLVRLINNLIDVTKIDAGYMHMDLSNINIVDLIENITLSVAQYIESKGMTLTFDTNVEEKILACDADKIERIILNLISNAVKFTKPGDCIYVSLTDGCEKVIISVKDTGIGIAEENQSLIFDRFVQVDKSFARNREGSGIGLSLVKSLVEMHNGTIDVKSELNKGSEFIVTLPVLIAEDNNKAADIRNYILSDNVEKIEIEFSDIYNG